MKKLHKVYDYFIVRLVFTLILGIPITVMLWCSHIKDSRIDIIPNKYWYVFKLPFVVWYEFLFKFKEIEDEKL